LGAGIFIQPPAFRMEGGRLAFGAAVLAAALALRAPVALAQEPPGAAPSLAEQPPAAAPFPSPEAVPEVRVEGRRLSPEEPERDKTAAASVILREDIERATQGVPEIVEQSVGARVREIGGLGSFSTVSIRGSTSNQVRVFLDGVPLDRGTGGGVNLSLVPAESLGRVEVYRGVAPLSVGGSAIGGVVDLRSRVPERDALEFFSGGGSFGWRRGGAYGAQAPGESPWFGSLSLLYEGAENDFGFGNDAGTPNTPADDFSDHRRNSDYNRGDALLALGRKLPSDGQLSLLQTVHAREAGLNSGDPATFNPPPRARLTEQFYNSNFVLALPQLSSKSELEAHAYFGFSRSQLDDPQAEMGGLVPAKTDDKDWLGGANARLATYPADSLKAEFFAEYRFERFEPQNAAVPSSLGPASHRHFVTTALGLEWQMVPEELLLIAQGRYERASDRLRQSNAGTPAGTGAARDALTGRGGVKWTPDKSLTLTANVGGAARFPSFTELFGQSGLIRGDPDIRQEESLSADAGAAWSLEERPWARRFSVSARYFFVDTKDLITFQANSQGTLIVINLPGARTHGAETELLWEPLPWARCEGNLTWIRARQKDAPAYSVPFVSEWQTYARTTLEREMSGVVSKAGVWGDFEYVSSNFLGPSNLSRVPTRAAWGAAAFADLGAGQWSLLLEAKNLTDERNLRNFAKYPLPGRTFLGTLRWRPISKETSKNKDGGTAS